jgi:predicted outer membrane protein
MKSKIAQTTVILAGVGLMFSAAALFAADGTAPNQPPSSRPADINDLEITDPAVFLTAVNNINKTKIEMGRLAKERGQSRFVRKLGARMVHDLAILENKTRTLASTKGILLPEVLDDRHQAMIDELATYSGAAFDRHYVEAQIEGHRQAISLLQQVAAENHDRSVREFAANTIPVLQQDLELAEKDVKIMNEAAGVSQGK